MGINYYMTWTTRPKTYAVPVYKAPRLSLSYDDGPAPPPKLQQGVLELAKKMDVWGQAHWHRRWERLPIRFTVWVTLAVLVASLFEIIPVFLIRSNVPTIASVRPYTPLELIGRDIYVAEGCYNCHSQMIRSLYAETERYGEYSQPGEFIYDHPFQWGSRRIGPDLARQGGRNSHIWHLRHFQNPRQYSESSVMPIYEHLLHRPINYGTVPSRVQAAYYLGAPYDEELTRGAEMAKEQAAKIMDELVAQGDPQDEAALRKFSDSHVIALIAYLQRLGTDLNKTWDDQTPPVAPDGSETDLPPGEATPGEATPGEATPGEAGSDSQPEKVTP
jgi:cytochrome c oxidase cbb3-type subunit I/II